MHYAAEGAFTGEVSAAMLTEAGVDASCSATRSAGSTSPRRTRRSPRRSAWRWTRASWRSCAVARPRRSAIAGDTERKIRHQVEQDLAQVTADELRRWLSPTSRSGRSARARRPLPRRRRRRSAFVRARVRANLGAAAAVCACCTAAASSRTTSPSCMAQPDIDGALVGGASLEPAEFARIVQFVTRRVSEPVEHDDAAERAASVPDAALSPTRRTYRPVRPHRCSTAGDRASRGRATRSRSRETPVFDGLWATLPAHAR